jgi:transcription-repair coupling factor (superfamily II helicase)
MPAAEIDSAMVRFAGGLGDVLLATNIIEAGLDVPRANTMIVWRADRFGMAQLHQLRGRVGRGRARGIAYLLTDPAAKIAKATEQRLRTLEAMDRVGAGFAISARDLDLRGAGDLLGEKQAGHLKLVGVELYHDLLRRALVVARGGTPEESWKPELRLDVPAFVPGDYIPEEEVRLNLYLRIGRLASEREADAFAAEIEDRFGTPPQEVLNLLETTRLRLLCRRLGVAVLEAGPQAVALTFRGGPGGLAGAALDPRMAWRDERLLFRQPSSGAEALLEAAGEALELIRRARQRGAGGEKLSRRRAG